MSAADCGRGPGRIGADASRSVGPLPEDLRAAPRAAVRPPPGPLASRVADNRAIRSRTHVVRGKARLLDADVELLWSVTHRWRSPGGSIRPRLSSRSRWPTTLTLPESGRRARPVAWSGPSTVTSVGVSSEGPILRISQISRRQQRRRRRRAHGTGGEAAGPLALGPDLPRITGQDHGRCHDGHSRGHSGRTLYPCSYRSRRVPLSHTARPRCFRGMPCDATVRGKARRVQSLPPGPPPVRWPPPS
jgi:hypothetical protein